MEKLRGESDLRFSCARKAIIVAPETTIESAMLGEKDGH